ncbi:bifunctional acetate--CoA ligase family protein/GNAT family N-acetyltransferase [Actinoallomurus rhizosphaericola]|uniref:bifunctional acetate--CoA ligase family protein/GNAT family N-acetyltransferase n=1 Tax=Actinoallomurus rhizosphaericola TaxID=2952536 RepID=UPI002091320B|nr:GNAT family N-acetyltransferase [Actinoallomurus rhizosphaericola]MCO5993664.1 GNAT family N-acetyltransferase [Actinoallomurus rhizosphaericola]
MPYPHHWEADVVLADGGTAHLRPIRAGDAELLREFYARLSPESIYYRFFSPRPQLTDREIEHFTTVDYVDRVALIATIGDAMVAVVRYDRLGRRPAAPGGAAGAATGADAPGGAPTGADGPEGRTAAGRPSAAGEASASGGASVTGAPSAPGEAPAPGEASASSGASASGEASATGGPSAAGAPSASGGASAPGGTSAAGEDIWRAAVAGYTAAAESADTAEVAFLVEDAQQGRGLGTVLLEHIAAAARERGIRRFIADVLPENRRMTTVFRAAGYEAQQRFEDGVIRLTLDLEPTETSREVMAAREHRAESRSIQRLLFPGSVAVIGASREARSVGQTVLRNLLGGDFAGPVFPVNPTAPAVAGVRAYPAVAAIPDPVDLAVVAVPGEHVNEVVAQCAAKGVHGLVVVSSGFGEAGPEGRARQDDLVRLARANGMRVVGPNCLGIANSDPGVRLNATLAPTLPGRGPVGFFSQSGALGITILRWAAERGLGLSTFVSAGNRADVSGNDLMQYWEEDPATEVILLYLESIGNPRKFTRLARRISRAKPIVAVKSGRTTQGVPLGHAARALSLPDHAVSALFAQAGVVRVDTLGDLFDVAQILAYQPLPTGRRVAIVGNSDSIGLLAQDAATAADLDPLPPVDLGPAAGPAEFEAALAGILADETADAVVTVFAPPVRGGLDPEVAAAIVRQAKGAAKPVIATYLGERGLLHGSVPSYPAPEDAVRALAYAVRYAERRRRPPGRVPELSGVDRERARALVEEMLAAPGAAPGAVPAGTLAEGAAPVDRREADPERTAELLACYGIEPADGGEPGDGAGIVTRIRTAEDPSFGAIVSFGLADPTAELLEDRAYRLAPLTDVEAAGLVRAIRAAPLLLGHRGADPVDVAALEHLLLRASRLSDDLPEVARLEIEVVARTSGAVVRSARLWVARPPGPRTDSVRRLRPF